MAWIESHQGLWRHPKTKKLARELGVSIQAAIGYLHMLWWWAMDYAEDGVLDRYEEIDIAEAVLWDGDPNQLFNAFVGAGFIDIDCNGIANLHDWYDYAGRLIEKRRANTERKRRSRVRHAPVTQDVRESHRATVPNRTVPNQTIPTPKTSLTPHKNREECSPEINLREKFSRYTNEQWRIIDDYWDLVRFTRRTGKVAESIILREMEYWERFNVDLVIESLRIHIGKYGGKTEQYTRGIMRRLKMEKERGREGNVQPGGAKPAYDTGKYAGFFKPQVPPPDRRPSNSRDPDPG